MQKARTKKKVPAYSEKPTYEAKQVYVNNQPIKQIKAPEGAVNAGKW